MKFVSVYLFLICIAFFSCADDTITPPNITPPIENPNPFIQLSGTDLVDVDGNAIYLQGVAFGNEIWNNSSNPPTNHHNELDYERVEDMGMNAIRFYLNYRTFEDDANPYQYKQSGWDWLDKNITWAKNHGVYLILNMHAPQGGYQSQGNGDDLWDDNENQLRLIALWKAIADHYKDEVQIAGYGPVNEPVPNVSITQWTNLAQNIIDEIRTVDEHHLLFIERAIYVKDSPVDANLNFPDVVGENLVYEFHGYDPHAYTHQLFDWANMGEGGKYPDENIIEATDAQWYTATFSNPTINSGTNDWTYFEGEKYQITDEEIKLGYPALVGARVGEKVYFDDIVIQEYDENGDFVRNIIDMNLDSTNGWYYWSNDDSGNSGLSTSEGHNDTTSLFIENTTDDCNLGGTYFRFIPLQNYYYQINGWMKGENIASNAACRIRIDFQTTDSPIYVRNKEYLEAVIGKVTDWAATKNAALYMGEFGAGNPCFQNDKGGIVFVKDMVDIAKANDIHFTYHSYHENSFGIYLGSGSLPDPSNVNQPLIDLFTEILN